MNAGGKLAVYGPRSSPCSPPAPELALPSHPSGCRTPNPLPNTAGAWTTGDGLPGLATATDELTLVADADTITAGVPTTYTFSVRDDEGPVVDFELEQTKRMHLIVVTTSLLTFDLTPTKSTRSHRDPTPGVEP